MTEETITTKRGVYGRVNITMPLYTKNVMLDWAKKTGWKKAEFLRLALTIGFLVLSRAIELPDPSEGQGGGTPPARTCGGRTATAATPYTDRGVEF